MITKEMIIERLEVLKKDLQTLQQNFAAIQGAMQDCEYWLTKIDTE